MISRAEYLYNKSQIKRIDDILFHFKLGQVWSGELKTWVADSKKLYDTWDAYIHLNDQERAELEGQWVEYYKQTAEGYYGFMFTVASLAYRENDKGALSAVIDQVKASNARKTIPPSNIDPEELTIAMRGYFNLKNKLIQMKEIHEEYKEVYETKSSVTSNL